MNEIRSLLGQEEKEKDCWDECESSVCSLSWEQRMWGFGICFIVGVILSVFASINAPGVLVGDPAPFAVPYSIGNALALLSTGFLMGPVRQIKRMFQSTRIVATCVYLLSVVATLVCAFTTTSALLVFGCIVVQFLALFWYALSYIPYGRSMVTGCCRNAVAV